MLGLLILNELKTEVLEAVELLDKIAKKSKNASFITKLKNDLSDVLLNLLEKIF